MADKIIVWEIRIGSMWVEVTEDTFIKTMRMWCDYVHICEGFAIFCNEKGLPIGKMKLREV